VPAVRRKPVTVPVSDIVAGDTFVDAHGGGWTAVENAEVEDTGDVTLLVRFIDGSTSWRRWDDPSHSLTVTR
jgi:hypothetical protein